MDISGLDKAAVLAALYNRAKPQGMGVFHYISEDITTEQARVEIDRYPNDLWFDYIHGRVLKVDLSGDDVRTAAYNRDNGPNAAENAVDKIR